MSSIAISFFDQLLSPFSNDNAIRWTVLLLTIALPFSRSVINTVGDSLVSSESTRLKLKMTLETIWSLVFPPCLSQVLVSTSGGDSLSTKDWMFGLAIEIFFLFAFIPQFNDFSFLFRLCPGEIEHWVYGHYLATVATSVIASITYSFTKKWFFPNAKYLFDVFALGVGFILARKGAFLLTFQLAKKSKENLLRRLEQRNLLRRLEERSRDLEQRGRDLEEGARDLEQRGRDLEERARDLEQLRERNSNVEENSPENMTGSNGDVTSSGSSMTFACCGVEEGEETKKSD